MVARPFAIAVTRPASDTVATLVLDVSHVTVVPAIDTPFWSWTVPVNVTVSPRDEKTKLVGCISIVAAIWATVTVAVALTDPDVAVIVAVPSVNALTSPPADTDATDGFDVVHDTLVPLIVSPFWSLTVAVSWAVCPNASKFKLVADNEIDVGKAKSGIVGLVPLFPHARTNSAAVSLM